MPDPTMTPHDEAAFAGQIRQAEVNGDQGAIELLQRERSKRLQNDSQWSEWYWTAKNFVFNEEKANTQSLNQLQFLLFTTFGWSGLFALTVYPSFRHWSLWLLSSLLLVCGLFALWSNARLVPPEFDNALTAEMYRFVIDRKRAPDAKDEKVGILKKLGITG